MALTEGRFAMPERWWDNRCSTPPPRQAYLVVTKPNLSQQKPPWTNVLQGSIMGELRLTQLIRI